MSQEQTIKAEEEALSTKELEKRLGTTPDGLRGEEAASRLEIFGYNEIPEKTISPVLKFLTYFWGPIPLMIMLAAVLSGVLHLAT